MANDGDRDEDSIRQHLARFYKCSVENPRSILGDDTQRSSVDSLQGVPATLFSPSSFGIDGNTSCSAFLETGHSKSRMLVYVSQR